MREVRRTFEHLMVILAAFLACLVVIFAIPGVRTWVFENAPAAVVKIAGPGSMSSLMTGVNPKLLASAVNDDETRAEIIALWKKSIPEMESVALAEMGNELLSDPNSAALLINVVSQLDEEKMAEFYNALIADPAVADHLATLLPQLDPDAVANLANALMDSEATANMINDLIAYADTEATARLINTVLADSRTAEVITETIGYLDGEKLAQMTNAMLSEASAEDSKLAEFVDNLTTVMDITNVAALLNVVLEKVDAEGNPVLVNKIDQMMESLDGRTFGSALFQMLDRPGTIKFIEDAFGNINPEDRPEALYSLGRLLQPYQEVNGGFDWQSIPGLYQDESFDWESVRDKFNWETGEGLYSALCGNRSVNDALLDYCWIETNIEKVYVLGRTVEDYMSQEGPTIVRSAIEWEVNYLISQPWFTAWWNQWFPWISPSAVIDGSTVAGVLGELFTDALTEVIGKMIGMSVEQFFGYVSQYVRVRDSSIGETPFWDMPFWKSSSSTPDPWGDTIYKTPPTDRSLVIYGPEDYLYARDENGNPIVG